jgi:hypothetical protein
MQPQDIIFLSRAAERTRKTERTIRRWCPALRYRPPVRTNAPWEISAPALEMVVYNDMDALELLRGGERCARQVRRYFDHLGISVEVSRR